MSSEHTASRLNVLLWLLAGFPVVVMGLAELNRNVLVWHFRVVDLADLVVLAPFYLVLLLVVQRSILGDVRGPLAWIGHGFIAIFLYGHAMHVTANAINTYSTEVQDYIGIIPPDAYQLIYFLDEDLGHFLQFGALFSLLGVWVVSGEVSGGSRSAAWAGAIAGLALAFSAIESSHPWIGFAAAVWLVACIVWKHRAKRCRWAVLLRSDPFVAFAGAVALSLVAGELAYFFAAGSFIQPSLLRR